MPCERNRPSLPIGRIGDLGEQVLKLGSRLPGGVLDDVEPLVGEEEPQDDLAVDGQSHRGRGG